jgi:alkylation response protein AidB-like acyl-CoA dehydrogenase
MNFDFSDDLKMLREQARKFLAGRCSRQVVRKVFEGGAGYDPELWAEIARMGWLGTAVPGAYGGSGVGYDGLCVLAEELGYVLAPVPFSSSIYLAAEAILIAGSEAQKQKLLPPMIDGSRIGTFALAEGLGNPRPEHIKAKVASGHLTGTMIDRAAILMAFEQVGGAQACLDMAKAYAMGRYAFGRPITAFQAIKHKLADVYVASYDSVHLGCSFGLNQLLCTRPGQVVMGRYPPAVSPSRPSPSNCPVPSSWRSFAELLDLLSLRCSP